MSDQTLAIAFALIAWAVFLTAIVIIRLYRREINRLRSLLLQQDNADQS